MSTRIVRYKIPTTASQWAKSLGVNGNGVNSTSVIDPSGNILLAAGYQGTPNFGDGNLPAAPRFGVGLAIAKYDSEGIHQWSHGFGGTDGSTISSRAVCSDASGSLYVVGSFLGTINLAGTAGFELTSRNASFQDCFIVKYSSAGVHLWSKAFGTLDRTADDTFSRVVTDSSENAIVSGAFRGRINLGGSNLEAPSSQKSCMAKFSPSGAHVWSTEFFGNATINPYCMTIDQADNVLLGGTFTGAINLANDPEAPFGGGVHRLVATASGNNTSIFLAKFSTNPNLSDPNWNRTIHQWSRRFGGATFASNAGAIAVDNSDSVILTGTFNADIDLGNGTITGAGTAVEAFLAKYSSSDGTFLWEKILGSFCGAGAVICTTQNNILLGGSFIAPTTFGGQTTYRVVATNDTSGYYIKYSPGSPGVPGILQTVLIIESSNASIRFQAGPTFIGLDAVGFCTGSGTFSGTGVFATKILTSNDGNIFLMHFNLGP